MSIETLTDAFATVGRQYGYEDVGAEFAPLADAKIRWQRSYHWIRFTVSDYLTDAPYEVFKELAEAIFSRIQGADGAYPQSLHDYLRSHAEDLKQTYIGRHSPCECGRDLGASVQRLIDSGYIPEDHGITVSWTKHSCAKRSITSWIFRHVLISADAEDVSDGFLDYIVYRGIVTAMAPSPTEGGREEYIDGRLAEYPDHGHYDDLLNGMEDEE